MTYNLINYQSMEGKNTKQKVQEPCYIPPTLFTSNFPATNNDIKHGTRLLSGQTNINNMAIGDDPNKCIICLNPYCTLPYSRIFQLYHPHKNVEACEKWVVGVQQLGKLLSKSDDRKLEKAQINLLQFNLGKTSIQQNIKNWKIMQKIDWTKYLLGFKNVFMQKIQEQFNTLLISIKSKIQLIKAQQMITNLSELHNNIVNKQKNQVQLRKFMEYIVEQYLNPLSSKKINVKCPQIKQFQIPALSSIASSLQQKIFIQKQLATKFSVVNQENHQQFRQFLLGDQSPFNKLQQASSMCGKKSDNYIIKTRSISLKCPFCNHSQKSKLSGSNIDQHIKMLKKQLAAQILTHCFNCHYSFIYSKYEQRKLKKPIQSNKLKSYFIREITFQQLIKDLLSHSYTKLHIFDRQSGIPNPPPTIKSQPNTYYLEILSKNNKSMARMKYIMTPDRKSTEFMINYVLVYVCFVQKLMGLDDVYVQSNCKDINRVSSLQFILLGDNDLSSEGRGAKEQISKNNKNTHQRYVYDDGSKLVKRQYVYQNYRQSGNNEEQNQQFNLNSFRYQHQGSDSDSSSQEVAHEKQNKRIQDVVNGQLESGEINSDKPEYENQPYIKYQHNEMQENDDCNQQNDDKVKIQYTYK